MNLDNKYIFDASFGLERETLRVTSDGALSRTLHPFNDNKYLDRDFCENQLELITPPCDSIKELMKRLADLDGIARDKLHELNEYLWLCSNPPHINSENDIRVAEFTGSQEFKHDYRIKLEQRYGKRLMLYSGIHFNFSFSEKLIKSLYNGNGAYNEFKNCLYFRLSKQVFRYCWLFVLLTAASPDYDLSLDGDGLTGSGFNKKASLRNGENGYWNKFIPILDYTDLYTYIKSINNYIEAGKLFSSGELYLPMRLKPSGGNSLDLLQKNGVNHIELRMFDINPLYPLGIAAEDLHFAHYFMLYLTQLPDFVFTPELQKTAVKNHQAAAGYKLSDIQINGYPAKEAAIGLLDDMAEYFKNFPKVCENINIQKDKLINNRRYSTILHERICGNYQEKILEISKHASEIRAVYANY